MIERGEYLSFFAEATQDEIRIHAALHELDGRALAELIIGARGFVDRAHAAASDFALDLIGTDAAGGGRFRIGRSSEFAVVKGCGALAKVPVLYGFQEGVAIRRRCSLAGLQSGLDFFKAHCGQSARGRLSLVRALEHRTTTVGRG